MPTGLRVRVVITQDGSVIDRTFDRSPVRIGRSPLNELQLQFGFVSLYHAVLEFDDKRIVLRDLGSTNGTALRTTGRVSPNAAVDITAHNFEFAIVSLWFQLFFVSEVPATVEKKRVGTVLSLSVDELTRHPVPETQRKPPGPDRTKALVASLQPLYDQYRAAWANLYREIQSVANPLDPGARAPFLEQLSNEMDAVKHEQDYKRLAGYFGVPVAETVDARPGQVQDQHVALQALRDLANYYVPQRGQLERTVDVVTFAQRIQDVLDVFFKCFLPLRDGHKQFKTHLDIRKSMLPTTQQMTAAKTVETAREPRELAARLLDWGDSSGEGPRAVESTFAEIMVHQVAMLSGVMRGVRSLLQKLAPPSIEAELENPRRRARGGMQVGPFRYKVLWELYAEVYGDFAEDEKQAFALIFGPEFAHAYSELAADAAPAAHQAIAAPAFGVGQGGQGGPGGAPGYPAPQGQSPYGAQPAITGARPAGPGGQGGPQRR